MNIAECVRTLGLVQFLSQIGPLFGYFWALHRTRVSSTFIYQPPFLFFSLHPPPSSPSCRLKVRWLFCRLFVRIYSLCSLSAIREYDAKLLLAYWLERAPPVAAHAQVKTNFQYPAVKVAQISWDAETDSITPDTKLPGWVFNTKLVAKPDQLIKRRGKAGLLALNKTWDEAKPWIAQRAGKPQKVGLVPYVLRIYVVVYDARRVGIDPSGRCRFQIIATRFARLA